MNMRGLLPGLEVAPDSISSDFCSRTRLNYEETQKNVLRLNRGLSVQSLAHAQRKMKNISATAFIPQQLTFQDASA